VAVLCPLFGCTGVITGADEQIQGEIEGFDSGIASADAPPGCGDGVCDEHEDCHNCAADCGDCPPACGDGVCNGSEDCATCPNDCGDCPEPQSWSFLVISDTRSDMGTWGEAVKSMSDLDPNAIALFDSGDIVADGEDSQWQEHKEVMADNAPDPLGVYESLFRADLTDWSDDYVRFIGVLGNHDAHASDWRENWAQYLPGQADLGMSGQVFYLTYANAIFLVLDSGHGDVSIEAQAAWLEQTLESEEAQAATWKFAFFHKPVYPCRSDKSPFDDGLEFVSILEREGVDMVFVGDSHSFERTCPMLGGRCAEGGVIYMNTASAGASQKAPSLYLDRTAETDDRTDAFSCAEILDSENGGDYYPDEDSSWFCHIVISGAQMELDCYFHDDISVPYSTLVLTK